MGAQGLLQRAQGGLQRGVSVQRQSRQASVAVQAAKGFGTQLKQKFAPKDYLK